MTVYKESDCASPYNEDLREFQIIDIFYQQASTGLLTQLPLFACCHIQKFIIALVS